MNAQAIPGRICLSGSVHTPVAARRLADELEAFADRVGSGCESVSRENAQTLRRLADEAEAMERQQ